MERVDIDAGLVAGLNDLLQLDHDAVQAYTLAITLLQTERYRESLRGYRADHERHVQDLTRLIQGLGGTPIELPHIPTGAFKLAVQAAGRAGGDRGVLLAFKANERQVRDKYRRAATGGHPPEVEVVLSRNAGDEEIHYGWVLQTLEELGVGRNTTVGRIESAFEVGHARTADAIEAGERQLMHGATKAWRVVREHKLATAAIAIGAGIVASRVLRRR